MPAGNEGTTLANRYQVQSLLGEGAMARVYRAYDTQRKCDVAIKLLRADYAEDHAFEQRFRVEARTLERLAHHSVVRYYGLERDGRSLFMVMEYVAGETLRTEMFSQAAGLSGKRILEILQPLAAALDFAHASGVLHRDLKPANVLLAADGRVFLSDFGVARMMDASTVTTFVVGTPAYMSPEQCASKELTAASDIYSLAVMAFEMLCGRRPFVGATPGLPQGSLPDMVRLEHLSATPPSVRSFRNTLPAGLDAVFAKSLSKVPAERPASAAALVESLARLIKTVPGSATVQLPVAAQAVQLNPVPLLRAISPSQATPDFVGSLAASGSDFVAQSVVHLDGRALPTKFVSATKVIAEVRVRKNAAVGSRSVTVVNPEPGGGTSNRMLLIVEDTPEVTRLNWLIVFGLLAVGAIMVLGLSFSTNLSGEASVLAPTAAQVSSAEPPLLATRFPPAPTAVPATDIPSTAVPPTPLIPKRIDPTATVVAAVSAATSAPADEVQQFPTALPTPVSVVGPAVEPAVVTCKNAGEWTGCGGKSELGLCAANEVGQCTDKLIYKCVLDTKCNGVAAPQVAASAAIAPGPLPSSGSAARTCSNKGEWTACGGKAELGICAPKEVGHCTDQNVYECVVDNNKCGAPSSSPGQAASPPKPTSMVCTPNGGIVNISGVNAWWVETQYWWGTPKSPGNGNTGAWFYASSRATYTALDGTGPYEWCRGVRWK